MRILITAGILNSSCLVINNPIIAAHVDKRGGRCPGQRMTRSPGDIYNGRRIEMQLPQGPPPLPLTIEGLGWWPKGEDKGTGAAAAAALLGESY